MHAARPIDSDGYARVRQGAACVCVLALLAAFAPPRSAIAQSLDAIVVTGSRTEQRSFDTPAAIDVVDRDDIDSAGPRVNLSESVRRVPGVAILNRNNYAQDLQLSIRGFGSRATFGIRGLRILIDDIPATMPDGQGQASSISLTSTDRIEVLRGPLAQLYGNSAGGVIRATTRDPGETPDFGIRYDVGSYGLVRGNWQASTPIATEQGRAGIVADVSTLRLRGWRDHSEAVRRQLNAKLVIEPSPSTRLHLVVNRFDSPLAEDPLGLTAAQLAANPRQAGTNAAGTVSAETLRTRKLVGQSQLGLALRQRFGGQRELTVRGYVGERDNLQFQANNAWVGLDRLFGGVGLQWSQPLTVFGRPSTLVAGLDVDRSRELREGGAAAAGEKRTTTRREYNAAGNDDWFAQATTLLADAWSSTVGVRGSRIRFESEDRYLADGVDGSGSVTYDAVNPVVGLTWHARPTLNVYATWGRGFETPTLAEVAYRFDGGIVPEFNPALRAARSRQLELGAKWTPTPRLRVDAATFEVRSRDEVVTLVSSGNTVFQNAPGTRRRGVELSAAALVSPHWSARLAATRIDARFSEGYTATRGGTTETIAADNRLPGVPTSQLFGELDWSARARTGPGATPAGTRAGLELVGAGRIWADDRNTASAPGYAVVNARASHRFQTPIGRLTGFLRVDNLADRRTVGSVIVNQASGQYYEPAPGRQWLIGLALDVPLH